MSRPDQPADLELSSAGPERGGRRPGDPSPGREISDESLRRELEAIVQEFPRRRGGALLCLHHVQKLRGAVSLDDQVLVAGVLGISPVHVRELLTFYTMLYEERPGRYHLQLCRTLSCRLRGAGKLKDRIIERLGIRPGETTPDGRFRLTEVECLASCGTAPVIQVNDDYFEGLTPAALDRLLDDLAARDQGKEQA
ncbi:MAG: NADH-quinone oxidoreductase subunit NuoE [Acidobacteriota bacterium]